MVYPYKKKNCGSVRKWPGGGPSNESKSCQIQSGKELLFVGFRMSFAGSKST